MTPEHAKMLFEADLKLDEMKVYLVLQQGLTTPIDIKKATGFKPWRVEKVLESLGKKFPPSKEVVIKTTKPSLVGKTFPVITDELLGLMHSVLGLPVPQRFGPREVRGMNDALNLAMKATGSYDGAQDLLAYYIRLDAEKLAKSDFPANYLPTVFRSYLAKRPEMPVQIYERATAKNLCYHYNHKNFQWEVSSANPHQSEPQLQGR